MAVAVDGIAGIATLVDNQTSDELAFEFGPGTFGEDGQFLIEFTLANGTVPNEISGNGDFRHLTFSFRDIAWQIIPHENLTLQPDLPSIELDLPPPAV